MNRRQFMATLGGVVAGAVGMADPPRLTLLQCNHTGRVTYEIKGIA